MAGILLPTPSLNVDGISAGGKGAPFAYLVDASGNPLAKLLNDAVASTDRALPIAVRNDENYIPLRGDRMGGLAIARLLPQFFDAMEGATINTVKWGVTATTMAATQAAATGITINSGNITTINTGYMLKSSRQFSKQARMPLQARYRARLAKQNNSVMELGFGDASTFNGANSNGAYWQVTSGGAIQPVLTFNGTDITGSDIAGSINSANHYILDVIVDDESAVYTAQDSSTGLIISRQEIKVPLSQGKFWAATHMPALVRLYITGTAAPAAPNLFLTDAFIGIMDTDATKAWEDILAAIHQGTTYSPTAFTQLAQFANSAEPSSATLSNTAAGYTTLGGKYQFAAVAGAATDYNLFNFTVPAPYQLYIRSIHIEAWNTGAAVATTPTLLTWGFGVNGTTANLSTGGYARRMLGSQSFPVAAAIGANVAALQRQFAVPAIVDPGKLLSIILRMPVGTATASQVIAGSVDIDGYFE